MMIKKTLTSVLLLSMLSLGIQSDTSFADEKVKGEGWDIPSVALGNGLTEQQKLDTIKELKVEDSEKYNEFIVDGNDLVKYVTDVPEFTPESKAYSSAYIVRTKEGSGVNVTIETPENITARTESSYRNAAITSGVYDADIRIASVKTMDGSGALAGIYKIYDEVDPAETKEEQEERDAKREVAQEEMAVTSEITKANSENKDFSDENLAVAMADIKLELQKINDNLAKMNEEEAKAKIADVVTKEMDNQGLSEIISPEQQDKIVDLMYNFKNSPSIEDTEMAEQLTSLKDDIMENGKEFLSGAKEKLTSEETKSGLAKIWQSITDFFSNLFGK